MDPGSIIQLVTLIVLIFLSGFFSAAETALMTVNLNKLRALQDEGGRQGRKAARVIKMREDSPKLLSTILIGNNIVNLSASALTTVFAVRLFGDVWIGLATGVLTLIIIILGEITPKTLATLYNVKLSLFFSAPFSFLMVILTPVIWILNKISRGLFRLFGVDPDRNPNQMTESELLAVVDVSKEEGVIEPEEKKMITNVVDFGDALSKDIMIPRADMVCVNTDAGYDDIMAILEEDSYSRIPVYKESKEKIVGILHIKDMILFREKNGKENFTVEQVMRKPVFVYEYQRTAQIFADMKTSSATMCIVLDEYGITAGLITMEDLIEEIVGDIRDEYDSSEDELIQSVGENQYDVDASIKLDDLNDAIGTDLESENYDSVGGLVIELLDRLPDEGDRVTYKEADIYVSSVNRNRVERVLITVDPDYKEIDDEEDDSES
jgi:Hemolysins and related proteins containing CBS domains